MNIAEAKFDAKTGDPIVQGRLYISGGGEASHFNMPTHQYLRLRLDNSANDNHSGFIIQPVTDMEQLPTGFYVASWASPIFTVPLSVGKLSSLCNSGSNESFFQSGRRNGHITSSPFDDRKYAFPVTELKVDAAYTADGISLAINGQFAAGTETAELSAEILITWAQMTLAGFPTCPGWKHAPKSEESIVEGIPDRPRDPRTLKDLLILKGLCWPLLKGKLSVMPAEQRSRFVPPEINYMEITNIGYNNFGYDESLIFSDANRPRLHGSGFASCINSNYWINIDAIGHKRLEQSFRSQDSFLASMTGDGLGHIRFDTWYGMEAGDPFGKIKQTIKHLDFSARLSENGLEITIHAELNDFNPATIASHRRERNSKLLPYTYFDLQVTLPWALLLVRRFSFANRASDFCPA